MEMDTYTCTQALQHYSPPLPLSPPPSQGPMHHTCIAKKLQPSLAVYLLQSLNEVPQRVAPLAQIQEEEVTRATTGSVEQRGIGVEAVIPRCTRT